MPNLPTGLKDDERNPGNSDRTKSEAQKDVPKSRSAVVIVRSDIPMPSSRTSTIVCVLDLLVTFTRILPSNPGVRDLRAATASLAF